MNPHAAEPVELNQLILGASVDMEGWLWKCAPALCSHGYRARPSRHACAPNP